MVKMQSTPPTFDAALCPTADVKRNDNLSSIVGISVSESTSFHEAVTDIKELRDDIRTAAVRRGCSATGSDETRDEVEKTEEDATQQDLDVNATISEEEFEGVLAELNATESNDDSMEELLGASSSETDTTAKKDEESLESEAEAAVKKLIDSLKTERDAEVNKTDVLSPKSETEDYVNRLVNSVTTLIGMTVKKNASITSDTEESGSLKEDEMENNQAQAISYEEPELKTSNTEQEFGDVLAELNATESGSVEELLSNANSDAEVEPFESNLRTFDERNETIGSQAFKVATIVLGGEEKRGTTDKVDADAKTLQIKSKVKALLESTPNAVSTKASKDHDDKIASLDYMSSDDSDDLDIQDYPDHSASKAAESSKVDTAYLRATLLSRAKEMVDVYKQLLDNDGFTGPEGDAARYFLTELGSELSLGKTDDSSDMADLKSTLISKDNDILTKNEIISDLKAENTSLHTNVKLLEGKLKAMEQEKNTKLSSMELLQDSIYKERDELKDWKREAEATLKNQSQDLDQLISQNSTLLDLCNEKEEFIKDLSQFKLEAEGTIATQSSKLSELSSQTSHLLEVCSEQQSTVKELTQWKSDAEQTMKDQSTDLNELVTDNASLISRCEEQSQVIKELSVWKAEVEDNLKSSEDELSILRTDNDDLRTKCDDQQAVIEKHQDDIRSLSHKLQTESFSVQRFEEDFLEHSKNMMVLKKSLQDKSIEIEQLNADIDELRAVNNQLAEQAKNASNMERENEEKEKITMKMNHHKELSYLKTQKMNLASKVESLLAEQDEFKAQVEALTGNAVLLEQELKMERDKHKETKLAIEGMEKALRVRKIVYIFILSKKLLS